LHQLFFFKLQHSPSNLSQVSVLNLPPFDPNYSSFRLRFFHWITFLFNDFWRSIIFSELS
jgi:hypothetical protein